MMGTKQGRSNDTWNIMSHCQKNTYKHLGHSWNIHTHDSIFWYMSIDLYASHIYPTCERY